MTNVPKVSKVTPPKAEEAVAETAQEIVKDEAWILANEPKIAIVGTTDHRTKAPFADQSWEIWTQARTDIPRWSRWFELHDFRDTNQDVPRDCPDLWKFIKDNDGSKPVYLHPDMCALYPEVRAQPYPLDEQLQRWGTWFFSSTVAWEMSLAITEIIKWREANGISEGGRIGLFGIDMADNSEYEKQKPGCRHFAHEALVNGIQLILPEECLLLTPGRLYGLGTPSALAIRLNQRKRELMERLTAARNTKAQMDNEYRVKTANLDDGIARLTGALEEVDHEMNNWTM